MLGGRWLIGFSVTNFILVIFVTFRQLPVLHLFLTSLAVAVGLGHDHGHGHGRGRPVLRLFLRLDLFLGLFLGIRLRLLGPVLCLRGVVSDARCVLEMLVVVLRWVSLFLYADFFYLPERCASARICTWGCVFGCQPLLWHMQNQDIFYAFSMMRCLGYHLHSYLVQLLVRLVVRRVLFLSSILVRYLQRDGGELLWLVPARICHGALAEKGSSLGQL